VPVTFDATTNVVRSTESSAVPLARGLRLDVDIVTPSTRDTFSCNSVLTNVAVASGPTLDPDPANNVTLGRLRFDRGAFFETSEICDPRTSARRIR